MLDDPTNTTIHQPEARAQHAAPPATAAPRIHAPRAIPRGPLPGTEGGWATRSAYALSDATAILAALGIARFIVGGLSGSLSPVLSLQDELLGLALLGNLAALLAFRGLYSAVPKRPVSELREQALAALGVTAGQCTVLAAAGAAAPALIAWLGFAGAMSAIFLPLSRALVRLACERARWWGTRVLVVGSGGSAASAFDELVERPRLGLKPVGFVDDGDTADSKVDSDWHLGLPSELAAIASGLQVRRAIAAVPPFDSDEMARLVMRPDCGIRHWIVLPPQELFPSLWTTPCEVAGRAGLASTNRLASASARRIKRGFDLIVALAVSTLALPALGLIALLVRLSSPGSVLYFQDRIGLAGRKFKMWKFRTMVPNAEQVLERYLAENPALRAEWNATRKLKNDPRVTWIGRWLRLTSLDELPQLWNILRGDMSLVGPRPLPEAEVERYGDLIEYRTQVPPGVTGLWQISGRNNTTYAERVDYDAYYVRNWSLWLDLHILASTVRVVLMGEGAY